MAIEQPSEIADLLLWYDAADAATITEAGGEVSQWDDKSTTGDDLTQAVAASQPNTSTVDGRPSLFFDGGDLILNTALTAVSDPDDLTIIAVITPDTALGNSDYIGFYQNTSFRWSARKTGTTYQWFINGATNGFIRLTSAVVAGETNWQIFRTRLTGTGNNDGLDSNGVTASEAPAITPGAGSNTFAVGAFPNGATPLQGHIHEVIVYDRRISDAERDDLADYLNAKWIGTVALEASAASTSGSSVNLFAGPGVNLETDDASVSGSGAALQIEKNLATADASASGSLASLRIQKNLSAVGATLSSSAATLRIEKNLATADASLSGALTSLRIEKNLVTADASTSGSLTSLRIEKNLATADASLSGSGAALQIEKSLSAVSAALSSSLANLIIQKNLEASDASTSGSSVDLQVQIGFAVDDASLSGSTALLLIEKQLAAVGAATSGASAALQISKILAAQDASLSGSSAGLRIEKRLAAATAAVSGSNVNLASGDDLQTVDASSSNAAVNLQIEKRLAAQDGSISGEAVSLASGQPLIAVGASSSGSNAALSLQIDLSTVDPTVSGASATLLGGEQLSNNFSAGFLPDTMGASFLASTIVAAPSS